MAYAFARGANVSDGLMLHICKHMTISSLNVDSEINIGRMIDYQMSNINVSLVLRVRMPHCEQASCQPYRPAKPGHVFKLMHSLCSHHSWFIRQFRCMLAAANASSASNT